MVRLMTAVWVMRAQLVKELREAAHPGDGVPILLSANHELEDRCRSEWREFIDRPSAKIST